MTYFSDTMRVQLKDRKIVHAKSIPYEIDDDYGWSYDIEDGKRIFNAEGSLIEADGEYYWFWVDKEDAYDINDNHIDPLLQFGTKIYFKDAIVYFTKNISYKEK